MTTPAPVFIVDYDPSWPEVFVALKSYVQSGLGELPHRIEHVGSTSVPGLAAKPIIDMDIVVKPQDASAAIELLANIGYVHDGDGGIPGRERFRAPGYLAKHHLYRFRAPGYLAKHHLYLCAEGNQAHREHIVFRDYLRAHADAVQEYGELKKRLATQYGNDREGYTSAKTEFIRGILEKVQS